MSISNHVDVTPARVNVARHYQCEQCTFYRVFWTEISAKGIRSHRITVVYCGTLRSARAEGQGRRSNCPGPRNFEVPRSIEI